MYLSTVFLSEIDNGVENAIIKCNEEFIRRFGTIQDYISDSIITDFSGETFLVDSRCDEVMALWDVFKDFKNEIFIDLPVIKAMDTTRTVREEMRGVRRMFH